MSAIDEYIKKIIELVKESDIETLDLVMRILHKQKQARKA